MLNKICLVVCAVVVVGASQGLAQEPDKSLIDDARFLIDKTLVLNQTPSFEFYFDYEGSGGVFHGVEPADSFWHAEENEQGNLVCYEASPEWECFRLYRQGDGYLVEFEDGARSVEAKLVEGSTVSFKPLFGEFVEDFADVPVFDEPAVVADAVVPTPDPSSKPAPSTPVERKARNEEVLMDYYVGRIFDEYVEEAVTIDRFSASELKLYAGAMTLLYQAALCIQEGLIEAEDVDQKVGILQDASLGIVESRADMVLEPGLIVMTELLSYSFANNSASIKINNCDKILGNINRLI